MLETKEIKIPEYSREADIKRLHFIEKESNKHLDRSDGEVLDIGCGNGIISINMGARGFKVTGVDVSEKAIEVAKSQNPFDTVSFEVLSAEELKNFDRLFDVIICSEVLEHLEDPRSLIMEIRKNLHDKGILIITVPNGNGPRELLITRPMIFIRDHLPFILKIILRVKRIFGYTGTTIQSAADNLDHIQFFTKRTLTKMAENSHFKIEKFSGSNFIDDVFPFSLLTRHSRRLQKIDAKIADKLPTSFTGGFFSVWKKQ